MHIPTFRADLVVKVIEGRGVIIVSEKDEVILRGKAVELVAAAIDGKKSEQEILDLLSPSLGAPAIHFCLIKLAEGGYIDTHPSSIPLPQRIFWQQAGVDPAQAYHKLQHAAIGLQAIGDVPTATIREALQRLDIKTEDTGHLNLVLTDNYLSPALAYLNETFLASQQPWMLVKPVGSQLWIGPLFYPRTTGCWACLESRLVGQRPLYQLAAHDDTALPALTGDRFTLPSQAQVAGNLVAMEVLKWFGKEADHGLSGALRTYDVHTNEAVLHPLTRRPQCPACGNPATDTQTSAVLTLQSQKKRGHASNGYRLQEPRKTYEAYAHHISPITGIVKHVSQIEVPGEQVHVYSASHNMRPVSNLPADLPSLIRDQSGGKGITRQAAKTSALCEALERFSGIYQGNESRILATYRELGEDAIHPNACMLFSPDQYAKRDAWHATCDHPFQHVPIPFEADTPIEWTPVWSLTLQRIRYLPTAYCYFNYKGPHPGFCKADSNGNASGNTLEEAVLQGLNELVERDSVSMWWYNKLSRPQVDISTFNVPYVEAMQRYYKHQNRVFWVLDLTTDLNIPTFAAISKRIDRQPEDIIFGFGTHQHAPSALQRAIAEMNQLLPFVAKRKPDGSTNYAYDGALEMKWWQQETVAKNTYLLPNSAELPRTRANFKQALSDDLLDDINQGVKHVGSLGLEVLVLNQTRPDIGLPTVKVIVPGLRIFWKRLAPGRLYDVPVKLGWLDSPIQEQDLNTFPFFL
ncbi:MAG: TOMM precursor leader peptide-binding protein [Bacteroidota bacterium]